MNYYELFTKDDKILRSIGVIRYSTQTSYTNIYKQVPECPLIFHFDVLNHFVLLCLSG